MLPRVLAIQNSESSGLGRFQHWWTADGLDLQVVRAFAGEPIPEPTDYQALVLLGGGLLPDADATAGWLPRERAVTAAAVHAGMPVLGICLGGQLLAHTCGGAVAGGHGPPESGSTELTRLAAADGDPLFGPLPATFRAIEHRVDAITALPANAVWLASSRACPIQGFRIGRCAWGLQFHPEVGADRLVHWNRERLRQQGFDPDQLLTQARLDEPAAQTLWRGFAGRFARIVRERREGDRFGTPAEGRNSVRAGVDDDAAHGATSAGAGTVQQV